MVILAPSPGLLWGGRTPKTHSPGQRCPPIVIGKSFLSAGRTVSPARWHWSIHHGFVPLRTPRAHRGSDRWAIYHPAKKNRKGSEEMLIPKEFLFFPPQITIGWHIFFSLDWYIVTWLLVTCVIYTNINHVELQWRSVSINDSNEQTWL